MTVAKNKSIRSCLQLFLSPKTLPSSQTQHFVLYNLLEFQKHLYSLFITNSFIFLLSCLDTEMPWSYKQDSPKLLEVLNKTKEVT